MAKSKYFELMSAFLVIFLHQFASGQTGPLTPPTHQIALPATSQDVSPAAALKPNATGQELLKKTKLAKDSVLSILYRVNYREIDRIKWPAGAGLTGLTGFNEKYQNLDDVKNISAKIKGIVHNCKVYAAQYESEVLANYGIKKGTIPDFDMTCEFLGVSLKEIKDVNHDVFGLIGDFLHNRFDNGLYRYLKSADYERTKIYQRTIFGMLGLPVKYSASALQYLVLLSLALNGFIIFKFLDNRF